MTQDPDLGRPSKRINAVLGLFDSPPHRDWLVWWTIGWTVLAGIAIAFPSEDTPSTTALPRWLDALLAAVVFGVLFGILPAYVRLLIRRTRYRRGRKAADLAGDIDQRAATPTAPSVQSQSASSGPPLPPKGEPWVQESTAAAPPEQPPSPSDEAPGARPRAASGASGVPRTAQQAPRTSAPARSAKGQGKPAPIDALDLSAVRESEVLTQARSGMPYPVARAVRAVQGATTLRDAYDGVLRGSEAMTVVLGVVTTIWAREYDVTTPQLASLREAMLTGGVSQGHWIQALGSIARPMSQHPQPVAGLAEALKPGKGGSGLIADLNDLVQERNRWAHGSAPRNELEAADRLRVVLPAFERAVDKAQFLRASPWILTKNSRYRRREGDFQVHASRAMGDHPDFEHTAFVSARPLADGVFYLHAGDTLIDMTPLVVMRQCPTCHQLEVSYADRLDEREGLSLKTFDRGHVLFDPSLVEEVRALAHAGERHTDTG